MEQKNKKPTNAQLQRRIDNAIVFVPKVKDTSSIYFSDKGLRLTITDTDDYNGYAVIETGYHRHVFEELNPNTGDGIFNPFDKKWINFPYSRPWLYTKRFIEIANENIEAIKVDGGYSYAKLFEVLKAKEDRTEFYIADYVDKWFYNIFQPLYSIAEDSASQFLVFESYMHNIARQSVILEEKKEDMTEKTFVEKTCENETSFLKDLEERVLFHKKSDEEIIKENIEATQADEVEQQIQEQAEG